MQGSRPSNRFFSCSSAWCEVIMVLCRWKRADETAVEQASGSEAGAEVLTSIVAQSLICESWIRKSTFPERKWDLVLTFQGQAGCYCNPKPAYHLPSWTAWLEICSSGTKQAMSSQREALLSNFHFCSSISRKDNVFLKAISSFSVRR